MAIYEFECLKCEIRFDVKQPMGSEHKAKCPECNTSKTKRIFSTPGLKIPTDAELTARLMGIPKSRLEKTRELKDARDKRKKDPQSEKDLVSNELHTNEKRSKNTTETTKFE